MTYGDDLWVLSIFQGIINHYELIFPKTLAMKLQEQKKGSL